MNKKLIIWDFDGVIADTEKLWLKNRMDLINEQFGLHWDLKTVTDYLLGMSDKTKRQVLDKLGIVTSDAFWEEIKVRDLQNLIEGFALTEGIEDIFKLTQFEQCIATGGFWEKTLKKIECVNIEKYFSLDKVFTADMVVNGKPDPDLFLLAAEKMGYAPRDCIVIEDSIAGMTAGLLSKMTVISFLGNNLRDDNLMEERIAEIGIKNVFYKMDDIKRYLLQTY